MSDSMEFSYREARSGAITAAIIMAVVIESAAVHFAVASRHPLVAWALSLTSLAAVSPSRPCLTSCWRSGRVRVRLPAGFHYEVRRIGLKLDDPAAFFRAWASEHVLA